MHLFRQNPANVLLQKIIVIQIDPMTIGNILYQVLKTMVWNMLLPSMLGAVELINDSTGTITLRKNPDGNDKADNSAAMALNERWLCNNKGNSNKR